MNVDTCIICGAPVPEGRQVCWICEHDITEDDPDEWQQRVCLRRS